MHVRNMCQGTFKNNPYVYNHFGIYNSKTQEKLTDKIDINIIELGKLEHVLPKEEKECFELVRWARFISSTSWEEYEMYGKGDEAMEEAVKELKKINEIDMEYERYIRREIARRDAYQIKENEREYREEIKKHKEEIEKKDKEIEQLKKELETLQADMYFRRN